MAQHFEDLCEDKARKGEGSYAIAYALLISARAQEALAKAVRNLGNGDASTHFGAMENLGMQLEKSSRIIADALGEHNS